MTDRINGFVVTFEQPIREDDAEGLRMAIMHLRNVVDVRRIPEDGSYDYMACIQARFDIRDQILDVLLDRKEK